MDNKEIKEIKEGDIPQSVKIEIDNSFFEKLIYKIKEEGVTPTALFFDEEINAISYFNSFVDYIDRVIKDSEWLKLKEKYFRDRKDLEDDKNIIKRDNTRRSNLIQTETFKSSIEIYESNMKLNLENLYDN